MRGIGATIGEISGIIGAIAAVVEEQGAATREIARSVQQAMHGAREVTGNIGGVARASVELDGAAARVLGAAGRSAERSGRLERKVEAFFSAMRTA
jgi:methyl-accepting chemotaxis protein